MVISYVKEERRVAQVLVRDLDTAVIEKLRERARRNGRSLEAELRLILQQAAGGTTEEVLATVDRVRAMFAGRTFSDSTELLREDRER
jgi:plasmid stability protein